MRDDLALEEPRAERSLDVPFAPVPLRLDNLPEVLAFEEINLREEVLARDESFPEVVLAREDNFPEGGFPREDKFFEDRAFDDNFLEDNRPDDRFLMLDFFLELNRPLPGSLPLLEFLMDEVFFFFFLVPFASF